MPPADSHLASAVSAVGDSSFWQSLPPLYKRGSEVPRHTVTCPRAPSQQAGSSAPSLTVRPVASSPWVLGLAGTPATADQSGCSEPGEGAAAGMRCPGKAAARRCCQGAAQEGPTRPVAAERKGGREPASWKEGRRWGGRPRQRHSLSRQRRQQRPEQKAAGGVGSPRGGGARLRAGVKLGRDVARWAPWENSMALMGITGCRKEAGGRTGVWADQGQVLGRGGKAS